RLQLPGVPVIAFTLDSTPGIAVVGTVADGVVAIIRLAPVVVALQLWIIVQSAAVAIVKDRVGQVTMVSAGVIVAVAELAAMRRVIVAVSTRTPIVVTPGAGVMVLTSSRPAVVTGLLAAPACGSAAGAMITGLLATATCRGAASAMVSSLLAATT